jgi:hypothetical protein
MMDVLLAEWLEILDREYFRSFIPQGGAAVKFAVTAPPMAAEEVRTALEQRAAQHNLAHFFVDGAVTRIHMIDHLFFQIARQVDWDGLAANLIRRLLVEDGFVVPPAGESMDYQIVATLSGSSDSEVRRSVRKLLTEHVERDYAMVREFRLAMLRLCQALLEADRSTILEYNAIHAWLRGEIRVMGVLKPVGMYQKIGRHTARDMFLSLAHWLRKTGKDGCLLVLDISRYTVERRQVVPDGLLFHSTAAVVDAYEVLRQFIDATDELEGVFITVIAPTAFITDEQRGLSKYDALKLRIWDEVHDKRKANPLSSLVRVAEAVA